MKQSLLQQRLWASCFLICYLFTNCLLSFLSKHNIQTSNFSFWLSSWRNAVSQTDLSSLFFSLAGLTGVFHVDANDVKTGTMLWEKPEMKVFSRSRSSVDWSSVVKPPYSETVVKPPYSQSFNKKALNMYVKQRWCDVPLTKYLCSALAFMTSLN